jgi:hypothetical protein
MVSLTARSNLAINKKIILLVFFVAMVGLVYVLATQYTSQMHKEEPHMHREESQIHREEIFIPSNSQAKADHKAQQAQPESSSDAVRFREQRNRLSRELNLMKKAFGQQSCDQLKVLKDAGKSVESRVSENGGWCSDTSSAESPAHMWDKSFSTALSTFLKGKVVGSFGDGPGLYKKHLDSLNEVVSYTAYDGAPYCEKVTGGVVQFLDLTASQFGLQAFDWIISVEVGEHIPAKFEDVYLDNLVRHAKEGIILSWAVPGQGGLSHVNNKPLEDVVAQLKKRGFDINKEAGQPLREAAEFKWLKGNVHIYRRIDPKTFVPEDV